MNSYTVRAEAAKDMPDITFRRTGRPPPESVAARSTGGRLLDVCDEARAPVSFSCRSATCGTCIVRVDQGASCLEPPDREERELLAALGLLKTHRLACRALVRPGSGHLVLSCDGPPPSA
jgi:ferredoxin